MRNYIKQSAFGPYARAFIHIVRRIKFELRCLVLDCISILVNWKSYPSRSRSADKIGFVCDIGFYNKQRWQVASQADLWVAFVERHQPIMIGSWLSYQLFGRHCKYLVSLEPRYNAPTIYFGKKHKRVLALISDSHSKQWLPGYLAKSSVTDILTPYRKTLLSTGYCGRLLPDNVHSFPWCVSDRLMQGVEFSRNCSGVLGFGKTGSDVYDLREWAFNTGLLKTFDYAGSGNKKYERDQYFNWLRQFDACVVAMSSHILYNYTVAKYFEIPSQGLLLLAFCTVDLTDFGFEDGVNCIFLNKENFGYWINEFNSNPDRFVNIRKAGYEMILSRHTTSHRLHFVDLLLDKAV